MRSDEKFVNNIMIRALILLVVESIILFIFFDNFIELFLGLIVGGVLSLLFFRIIYLNIVHAIEKTENQAKMIMTINYMIRYIISGLVLFVCAKSPYLNIFTCMIGLLTIKLTLYIYNISSYFGGRKEG